MLIRLSVASYPHLKEAEQRKLHRRFHTLAYPVTHSEVLTTKQLAERLRGVFGE